MMAKESELSLIGGPSLDMLAADLGAGSDALRRALPPVHLWNPPFCGDIDMRIARDGTWFYGGTPIGRPAMVRLFASVLRKDEGRHVLVTPVEKVGITVDDAPFLAVEMKRRDGGVALRTTLDDWVDLGDEHPLRFEAGPSGGLKPYARVRGDLWALLARPLFYELMEIGETRDHAGRSTFGIAAGQSFFPIMGADELDRLADVSGE